MQARILTLAMALLALGTLVPLPVHAQPDPAFPAGCAAEAEARFVCEWTFDVTTEPIGEPLRFPIPVFERTHVNLTVSLDGRGAGWIFWFSETQSGDELGMHAEQVEPYEGDQHVTTSHFFETDPTLSHEFHFHRSRLPITFGTTDVLTSTHGTFTVRYEADRMPDGRPASRAAATRDDPHLLDASRDAPAPPLDIIAAWFDDPQLGDGAFTARLATQDASAEYPPTTFRGQGMDSVVEWSLMWDLAGATYSLTWQYDRSEHYLRCYLKVERDGIRENAAAPGCGLDTANSTYEAHVLESAVGYPTPSLLFTNLRATSATADAGRQTPEEAIEGWVHEEDSVEGERYAFALGSVEVWDQLNPRLKAPDEPVMLLTASPAPIAWYAAPFARDNLPDTLQVLGALIGSGTFLVGALLLWRRRRGTRRLLAQVEDVEAAHENDARAGLVALGQLDAAFARMLMSQQITEVQYHVLSQRIAAAARRLEVRATLKHSDGVAGHEDVRA